MGSPGWWSSRRRKLSAGLVGAAELDGDVAQAHPRLAVAGVVPDGHAQRPDGALQQAGGVEPHPEVRPAVRAPRLQGQRPDEAIHRAVQIALGEAGLAVGQQELGGLLRRSLRGEGGAVGQLGQQDAPVEGGLDAGLPARAAGRRGRGGGVAPGQQGAGVLVLSQRQGGLCGQDPAVRAAVGEGGLEDGQGRLGAPQLQQRLAGAQARGAVVGVCGQGLREVGQRLGGAAAQQGQHALLGEGRPGRRPGDELCGVQRPLLRPAAGQGRLGLVQLCGRRRVLEERQGEEQVDVGVPPARRQRLPEDHLGAVDVAVAQAEVGGQRGRQDDRAAAVEAAAPGGLGLCAGALSLPGAEQLSGQPGAPGRLCRGQGAGPLQQGQLVGGLVRPIRPVPSPAEVDDVRGDAHRPASLSPAEPDVHVLVDEPLPAQVLRAAEEAGEQHRVAQAGRRRR